MYINGVFLGRYFFASRSKLSVPLAFTPKSTEGLEAAQS